MFFISNIFINNTRLKLAKNQENVTNTLKLNFGYLKIIHILHPRYHPKIIGHILKNKQKSKRFLTPDIARLIILKMEMKMKNRSRRYHIRLQASNWRLYKRQIDGYIDYFFKKGVKALKCPFIATVNLRSRNSNSICIPNIRFRDWNQFVWYFLFNFEE